jgi:hypothetical protein
MLIPWDMAANTGAVLNGFAIGNKAANVTPINVSQSSNISPPTESSSANQKLKIAKMAGPKKSKSDLKSTVVSTSVSRKFDVSDQIMSVDTPLFSGYLIYLRQYRQFAPERAWRNLS